MGCASSGPLFEKGKNLVEGVKETANDTVIKGEKVLNDTTDTIKDGISSGLESVKETVQGALNTAEESVENVANKIGQNFHHHLTTSSSNDLMDNVKNNALKNKEDLFNSASETAAEAVSETETLILTEVDQAKEAFQSGTSPLFETIRSLGNNMEIDGQEAIKEIQQNGENLQESLKDKGEEIVEDLESKTRNFLGESVRKNSLIPMEELLRDELNNKEDNKKEESPPTFWEAAADAILINKSLSFVEAAKGDEEIFDIKEKVDSIIISCNNNKEINSQENLNA